MAPVRLHNKAAIETLLRQEVYLQVYGIGDLDDFFWPYTTWYAESSLAESSPIALVYTGMPLPTLLIFSARTQEASHLLASIAHLLPQHFHAHLSTGLEAALLKTHRLDSAQVTPGRSQHSTRAATLGTGLTRACSRQVSTLVSGRMAPSPASLVRTSTRDSTALPRLATSRLSTGATPL